MKKLSKLLTFIFISTLSIFVLIGCSQKETTDQKETTVSEEKEEVTQGITIEHEMGETTLSSVPKNIVTLEYSFVDALVALDTKPVGIADDNKSDILIKALADKVGSYTSVGTRSQPNLEVISSLKPDLIIADLERHKEIYEELSKIAPTIVLKSLESSYDENINAFNTIAKVLQQEEKAEERLNQHNEIINDLKEELAFDSSQTVLPAAVREDSFNAHAANSFTGQLLEKLGMKNAIQQDEAYAEMTLEQLVDLNPDVILIMQTSEDATVVDEWKTNPLWKDLKAVKNNKVIMVDRNLWTRFRGVIAGEEIAKEAVNLLK